MRRVKEEAKVQITNLKGLLPVCRRCRLRSDEMLRDKHQPMLCEKCVEVIADEYPHMVPIEEVPFERARDCLWNHERECECWHEGLTFPMEQP